MLSYTQGIESLIITPFATVRFIGCHIHFHL